MKRTRRSDYGEQSWWTQDHGGLPGWAMLGVVLVILALGIFIAALLLNPR
ncbi:hypothetical protein [Microbacterium oleivorans]|uniref:Uncharacterized protein n=1 Tax=Microbacterium oleivorans TaxID=273677 RepID=A0A7D5EXQ1_9MICO|nr:hypothetical protein [Microbacterium oleivorans]QLD12244.1 hypothetical protein HW566_10950 [Microbacterium oleivorans]